MGLQKIENSPDEVIKTTLKRELEKSGLPLSYIISIGGIFRVWISVLKNIKFWLTFIFATLLIEIGGVIAIITVNYADEWNFLLRILIAICWLMIFIIFSSLIIVMFYFLVGNELGKHIWKFPTTFKNRHFWEIIKFLPLVIEFLINMIFLGLIWALLFYGVGYFSAHLFPNGEGNDPLFWISLVIGWSILVIWLLFTITNFYGKMGRAFLIGKFGMITSATFTSFVDLKYFKLSLNRHYFLNGILILVISALILVPIHLISNFSLLLIFANQLTALLLFYPAIMVLGNMIVGSLFLIGSIFAHYSVVARQFNLPELLKKREEE